MTTTWTTLNAKLSRFLDDTPRLNAAGEEIDPLFAETLRIDSWNWAQRSLLAHSPRARTRTLDIETGEREAILPSDFYATQGIYDTTEERWWWPVNWQPGDTRYTDDDSLRYWTFAGRLYMENKISVSSTRLTLYYWAYYPEIEYHLDDDDEVDSYPQEVIYTPSWAEVALCHLTAAGCMNPGEIFASDINQYKIRVDSGNPLMNPREQSIKFHLSMWNWYMDLFPELRREVVH